MAPRTGKHGHVDELQPFPAELLVQEPGDDRKGKANDDTERNDEVRTARTV